jgi:hypothetical protein
MNWKNDWEEKLLTEYKECSWNSIEELLKDAYEIAKKDIDFKHQYTHLILFNLQLLAEYGIQKISFKQWKSFRAYVHDVKRQNIKIEDLFVNVK